MSILNTIKFIVNHPVNRGNKCKAILRFVRWQIGSRFVSGAIAYDWINNSRFLVRAGETGLTGNIYAGLHEFTDMAFLLHLLRPEDLFIDVGANVGSYSILAGAAIGSRGYAFEPVPSTYKRLVENMRLNHLSDRVSCLNLGVGCDEGSVTFTSDRDTVNHVLAIGEVAENPVQVAVVTLDSVLEHEAPTLIKIDVEGYELPVLEGALETLQKNSLCAVIMEINGSGSRYKFDESKIFEMMSGFGFKPYSYEPLSRLLVKSRDKNLISGNTLFVRDEKFVINRLQSAPNIRIYDMSF